MSRAIKFRVWDTRGRYFRRANIEGPKNSAWGISINRGIFSLESTEGLVYQQWTGLLDSNNKEIYEGDILSKNWLCRVFVCENTGAFMVKFHKTLWINKDIPLFNYLSQRRKALQSDHNEDCEIIGNIFENPELLAAV